MQEEIDSLKNLQKVLDAPAKALSNHLIKFENCEYTKEVKEQLIALRKNIHHLVGGLNTAIVSHEQEIHVNINEANKPIASQTKEQKIQKTDLAKKQSFSGMSENYQVKKVSIIPGSPKPKHTMEQNKEQIETLKNDKAVYITTPPGLVSRAKKQNISRDDTEIIKKDRRRKRTTSNESIESIVASNKTLNNNENSNDEQFDQEMNKTVLQVPSDFMMRIEQKQRDLMKPEYKMQSTLVDNYNQVVQFDQNMTKENIKQNIPLYERESMFSTPPTLTNELSDSRHYTTPPRDSSYASNDLHYTKYNNLYGYKEVERNLNQLENQNFFELPRHNIPNQSDWTARLHNTSLLFLEKGKENSKKKREG